MTDVGRAPAPSVGLGAAGGAAPASQGVDSGQSEWSRTAVYTLGFLTLVSMFNYLDRSLLSLALPLIKDEMQLSDTTLGLLSGLAFVLFYSTLGLPIANLADRSNRRNIIAIGFAFWSLMTALHGLAQNIWHLALARFLMGAGEACGLAPSQSMISDLFSKAKRPLALAIFTSASAVEAVLFFPIAGWIAQNYGWREMFVAAGIPGVVLAIILLLTVREPERGRHDQSASLEKVSMWAALRFLIGSRAFLWIQLGTSFMGGALYSSGAWGTMFLVRVHDLSLVEISGILGPIRGVLGAVGIVLGGIVADRLGRRDPRWRIWTAAAACLILTPSQFMFTLSDVPAVWLTGLALTSLLMVTYQGPVFATLMTVAKPRMRAVAVSVVALTTGLVGQIFGPLIVGLLNDVLDPVYDDHSIRYSLLVVAFCTFGAAISFLLASRHVEPDARRARELAA